MRDVLITGGSNGIGFALCKAYLNMGDRVYNLDLIDNTQLTNEKNYTFYKCDLKDHLRLKQIWEKLPMMDILILNAAMYDRSPFLKQSIDEINEIIDVNLIGHIVCAKEYANAYNGKNGCIIVITSTRAYMSEKDTIGYTVSKGALSSLVHGLAVTLQEKYIRVNGVAPGWINSHDDSLRKIDNEFHLSNRVGKPQDIVKAVMFLSDASNDFITGEIITIDGGITKKMIYTK